jgi:hypothetical protein
MIVDAAAFVGPYPFRHVPRCTPDHLLQEMDRLRIDVAWVGHLGAAWHRDPRSANTELRAWLAPHGTRLLPVPTIHPGLPHWEDDVAGAAAAGAPAVRAYPMQQGLDPAGREMLALLAVVGERGLALVLTARFEDVRQQHPLDVAAPLPASALRALARTTPSARVLVTHADRGLVEEVHFGLTPAEATRLLWEVSWIWGPPEDHLALLLETVGDRRFTFGSGMPLRIGDGVIAKLDLLEAPVECLARLTGGNLREWLKSPAHL